MSVSTPLAISDDLSLPLDFVTQTQAILARKRVGKSYTASVQAEEMLKAGQQVLVIDYTGAWYGLRAGRDGKPDGGLKIHVFGGDHADVPLEERAGEVIATAAVKERFSAILDLSHFRKAEALRFLGSFFETLYRKNRDALHLFADECDAYAPQRAFDIEAGRTLGAMNDIVRRGGIRGIGCTLISQRPAVINKDILTMCSVLTCLCISHPRDLAPVKEWVELHDLGEKSKEMLASLPSLPIGTCWMWAPSWPKPPGIFQRVKIRRRETFDSGATPVPGQATKAAKALRPVDLEKLGEAIQKTVEQAKANDPAELKRRIRELEQQIATRPAERQVVEVPVITDQQIAEMKGIVQLLRQVNADGQKIHDMHESVWSAWQKAIDHMQGRRLLNDTGAAVLPSPKLAKPLPLGDGFMAMSKMKPVAANSGLRRILIALAQRPGLNRRQIGLRAGLSSQSGTFSTYLSKIRKEGWARDEGDRLYLTDAGKEFLGHYTPLPTGPDLLAYWLSELGNSGAARILQALGKVYPATMTNEQIGEAAGITHTSGTFGTYMSKLRGLELIEGGRGNMRASSELFE